MVSLKKPLQFIAALTLSIFFTAQGTVFAAAPTSFQDLPTNPLYYPAIEIFQGQNLIIGDTAGGKPIGSLRPADHIQRDEFTKVAVIVSLLEEGSTHLLNEELNPFTLKLNTLLQTYYKVTSGNGAVYFTDIKEKDEHCAAEPSGCSPWHTEYINYASGKGMIKGFVEDNTFRPKEPILRIHALKLAMKGKLTTLKSNLRIQSREDPRCLAGAENYILQSNSSSQEMLDYAITADKLDIFGNACQAFTQEGLMTPAQRAAYLQQPLRRQEVARYFALTTQIPALQLNAATDKTVDTSSEYIAPVVGELREEKDTLSWLREQGYLNNDIPNLQPSDIGYSQEPELIYINRSTAEMTITELTAISRQGRCCAGMDVYSGCKVIQYANYAVADDSEYGSFIGGAYLWNRATRGNETCYIPFADILDGHTPPDIRIASATVTEHVAKKVKKISYHSPDCGVIMSCDPTITYETVYETITRPGICGVDMSCESEPSTQVTPPQSLCNPSITNCMNNEQPASGDVTSENAFVQNLMTAMAAADVAIEKVVEVAENEAKKVVIGAKHGWFYINQPEIAAEIGIPNGSENISSIVANFSLYNSLSEDEKAEGTQTNAFRHVLWQAEITKRFGEDVAKSAGNAHEIFSGVIDDDKINAVEFSELIKADEAADIRNNIIGREIGAAHPEMSTKELAMAVMERFKDQGLWTAEEQANGTYTIRQEKLTQEEYEDAIESIMRLSEKGEGIFNQPNNE